MLDIDELARIARTPFDQAKPVLLRCVLSDPETDFFGDKHIDEFLSHEHLVQRAGVFRDQDLIGSPANYTREFLEEKRRELGTLVTLRGLQRLPGPVRDACVGLMNAGGWPSVHALSLESDIDIVSLKPHWDMYPVIAVQTRGHKRWRVQRPLFDNPNDVITEWYERNYGNGLTEEQVRSLDPEHAADDVVLQPGDVYIVPAGWLHAPSAVDGSSTHVSIALMPMSVTERSGNQDHFLGLY